MLKDTCSLWVRQRCQSQRWGPAFRKVMKSTRLCTFLGGGVSLRGETGSEFLNSECSCLSFPSAKEVQLSATHSWTMHYSVTGTALQKLWLQGILCRALTLQGRYYTKLHPSPISNRQAKCPPKEKRPNSSREQAKEMEGNQCVP